jgi:adenylate cyclase
LALAVVEPPDAPHTGPAFRATGAVCNLAGLADAAGASGFLNAAPDADGILRRVPVVVEFGGRLYPSLALAAVASAAGVRPHTLQVANANTAVLRLVPAAGERAAATRARVESIDVPLDGRSNLLVRYRGLQRTFSYVSAADVLEGRVRADAVRDAIVFVGTTALGTREVVATPLDTLFAGVEVQATVADNLLGRDFIHRPEHGTAIETQTVVGLGVLVSLAASRFGLAWGTLAAGAGLVGTWAAAIGLLSSAGAFLSPLFPTLGVSASLATMTAAGLALERRRADRAGHDKATSQRLMVQTLLSLTEMRDAETGRHSRRTQEYARVLATELAKQPGYREFLTPERIELLASLAPLHDIGKVGVPDRLLTKPGGLTEEELQEMRRHPEYGREVILNAERAAGVRDDATLSIAKDLVYTHHEKWDGTGYPQGLRGTEIPIPGRVMALVDVYDAVLTRRLYDAPRSHEDTVALIVKGRGTHFDPAVVDAFVEVAPEMFKLAQGA